MSRDSKEGAGHCIWIVKKREFRGWAYKCHGSEVRAFLECLRVDAEK